MVLCRLRPQSQFSANKSNQQQQQQQQQQLQSSGSQPLLGMIALAIALPPPTVHEVRLEPDMFVTRLSFDFRIVHCEPRYCERTSSRPEFAFSFRLF
jgi:neuronal PAS domain-containing protein 1/3